jgi:hypothetical protein
MVRGGGSVPERDRRRRERSHRGREKSFVDLVQRTSALEFCGHEPSEVDNQCQREKKSDRSGTARQGSKALALVNVARVGGKRVL